MTNSRRDDLLVPEQFVRLNKQFYEHSPNDYFQTRFVTLMIAVGRPEDLYDLWHRGVQYRDLRITFPDQDGSEGLQEDADDDWHERYAQLESQVLLHHAAETLLRLFFVHADQSPCPWLAMTDLRIQEYKKRLQSLAEMEDEELRSQVEWTFYGGSYDAVFGEAVERPDVDAWHESVDTACTLLRHWASMLLSDNHLYNSVKHGLSVQPQPDVGFQLSRFDTAFTLSASGEALCYLSLQPDANGILRWGQHQRWLSPEKSMAQIKSITMLIESLWSLAKARYVRDSTSSIRLLTRDHWKVLEPDSDISIGQVRMQLSYFVDIDEEESN